MTDRADKTQVPDDSPERKKKSQPVVPSQSSSAVSAASFFTSAAFKVAADAVLKYFNKYPANAGEASVFSICKRCMKRTQ